MLQRLLIQNYALIENLDIDFSEGLTIITGETGAGKSILLGALSLILGQRADTQALLNKEKKCVVEGEFFIKSYNLQQFFKDSELDYSDSTVIRREINQEGKSRAFINDSPVNLNQLKELGSLLVDVHSQHETLTLNKTDFQLSVVDAYAGNKELFGAYQAKYRQYTLLRKDLETLTEQEQKSRADLDYFQFQFNELEQSRLDDIHQQDLEQELETLNHAEEIKTTLEKALFILRETDLNLLNQLNELSSSIGGIGRFYPPAEELNGRLKSCTVELKDIAHEIESASEKTLYDPRRIEILNSTLDGLYSLQKKHRVSSVEELVQIREDLSGKLLNISSLEDQIAKLSAHLEETKAGLLTLAGQLSEKRAQSIPGIEQEIRHLLKEVGMPNASLKVQQDITQGNELSTNGIDSVKFLFSANQGVDYRELAKVASGGELSRLMLCIKALIARLTALPTIIFDEIDTGISGEVAQKVGNVMNVMARNIQVIAITHLPQIAGKGTTHYFVYKENNRERATSSIRQLTGDERIVEIAKMLSGENPTIAAMENAKELLNA